MNKLICAVLISLSLVGCVKKQSIEEHNTKNSELVEKRNMKFIAESNYKNDYVERSIDCTAKTVIYYSSSGMIVKSQSEVNDSIFDDCKGN